MRRSQVIGDVASKLIQLSKSQNFYDIAQALVQYENFCTETAEPYARLVEQQDSLRDVARTQLLALAQSEDPAQIATGINTYKSWEEKVETEMEAALKQQNKLVDKALDEIVRHHIYGYRPSHTSQRCCAAGKRARHFV